MGTLWSSEKGDTLAAAATPTTKAIFRSKLNTPDWEGTKAEADAKRERRAKIVFIILTD